MKKYLPYANYLAVAAGLAGALLRWWTLSAGPDSKGLYPAAHPGWIGYLLVMAAAAAVLFLMTRDCGKNGSWTANFPRFPAQDRPNDPRYYLDVSKFFSCGTGYALAGLGILLSCKDLASSADRLHTVVSWGGFLCGIVMLFLCMQFCTGKTPTALLHLLPCLYFALQLFLAAKLGSTETQLLLFLPQVLALGCSALAGYELAGFGLGIGNRRKSLFWSLSAAALCFAAVPGGNRFFVLLGLWHLMSHCRLTEPAAEESPAEAPDEE